MKKKSNILKGFLATASLCGTLLASSNAGAATVVTLGSVSLNTGAGLVGGLFNNGDTIQIAVGGLATTISADKPNAQIGGITTLLDVLTFGGVQVSQNVSIGPLTAVVPLDTNFGPLKFIADNATTTITGIGNQTFSNIDFAGKNSTLQINDGLTIATTINNSVATTNGTVNLGNGTNVTKDIGGTNSLLAVNINGSGNINLGGIVKAATVTVANAAANATATGSITGALNYTAAGTLTAKAGITGNVDFKNNAGILNLSDGTTITGTVNSTNGINGTLNTVSGTITGAISNLNLLQCSAGNGQTLSLNAAANVKSIVFVNNAAASGTINAAAGLTAGGITFNNGNAAGGKLVIGAASTINGEILNGIKGTINVNASLTISHPSAGSINLVNIANGTTYTIDANGSNIDLLSNGAQIVFQGADSKLALINSNATTNGQFTLYSNLNPANADEYGIVEINSGTKNVLLTITNNGNILSTIGQDNTHRLKNFIVDGAGNIVINSKVFTKLLSMNSTGTVTFNQALDLGLMGNIAFGADGTLVANGVNSSVTTSENGQGTLTIQSGNVSDTIGAKGSSLKLVNIGANTVNFLGNVFAPVALTNVNSALVLADDVTLTGAVTTTAGDGSGKLTFEVDGTIDGAVGADGAALGEIIFNGVDTISGTANAKIFTVANAAANATITGLATGDLNYTADGSLYAEAGIKGNIDFANINGSFGLGDNATIAGAVTSTGGVNGALTFIGNGVVTGNIGTDANNSPNIINIYGDNTKEVTLNGNVFANTLVFAEGAQTSGKLNVVGGLTLNGVTFNPDNADGGTLVIGAASTINGPILNGINGIIQVNANLTINDPSAGSVNEVDIADNTTYTIDANGNNVDLLNNGAKIVFQGADSKLALINSNATTNGQFTLYSNLNPSNANDNYGIVEINSITKDVLLTIENNGGQFTIGQDVGRRLKDFIVEGVGDIEVDSTVFTSLLSMNSTGTVTFNQALNLGANGNIVFGEDGTLVVNGVSGLITTSQDSQGTLTIQSGDIATAIADNNNKLKLVNIRAGASNLLNRVYAYTVALTDQTTALTFNSGVYVIGNIATTAGDKSGKLIFAGGGSVGGSGNVGADGAALEEVIFNGNNQIYGTANAATFTVANNAASATITKLATGDLNYTAAGAFMATGGLTGDINFNGKAGTFNLGNGATLTGTVTDTGVGTLNALGSGTITGAINNLDVLEFSGGNGTALNLNGNTTVNSVIYTDNAAASGTINVNAELTAGGVTFNSGNAAGGTLVIGAASTINGAILNGINGIIQVNANLTINNPSAGSVGTVYIADDTVYTIDAKNGNVDLLNNGAKIVFEGADSELDLVNTGDTDKQFTLYANLNPSSTQDIYGIVRVGATTNGVTIANNGATIFTIGQDATHRLKNFIVDGAGNIVINSTVFTQLLSMNSTGTVTFNQALDLGAGGNIAFKADGTLVVNGVNASVTTSENGQGTLTIQKGDVNGTIGDNNNSLKLVNIGANAVNFLANVFAPVALTDADSEVTLADGVKLTGAVTTKNNTKGILSLGVGSSVTGQIGAAGAVLQQVNINAGASSLGKDVYAGSVILTDATSELTLEGGVTVNSAITVTDGDKSGKLIFAADGIVDGAVGADGAALEEIVFNRVDTINGAANAATFTVANAAAQVTITGLATGDLNYDAAGAFKATGGLTGDIDFNGNAGIFNLGDGATLTGIVTDTKVGTLKALGSGTITGAINNLDVLEFSGGNGTELNLQGNTQVSSVIYTDSVNASGAINVNTGLDAGTITFNASNKDGGTLVINAASTVGVIVNPDNGNIVINADFTITAPNAGDINQIKIANNTTYTIDSVNGNIDLLEGDNEIIFEGQNSQLALINSSVQDDRTFTLHTNLNPSDNAPLNQGDGYGVVRVSTAGQDLTIANDGGQFTIGQDNTHRLQNFIVSTIGNPQNPGSIVIDSTVFTKLLSMNSTGTVTFNQALDLGAGGNIVFGADGTLVVNGVTGLVTTSKNGQGTLTIQKGDVSGTIGDSNKSLKLVNIGANAVNFLANVFAPVSLTDAASEVTLADGVKLTGAVTTKNNTKGILSLGVDSSVIGQIGVAGAALQQVNIAAGNTTFKANIYAGSVVLTDATSVLILNDNVVVDGAVTTKNNTKGILSLGANSNVTGQIGAAGAVLQQVNVGAGASSFGKDVYAGSVVLTDATSELTLEDSVTVNSAITTTNGDKSGKLIFAADGAVDGAIGADGAALAEIVFNGVGIITGTANAAALTVANAAAEVTITGLATGDLNYTTEGEFTATGGLTGNIDFNNNAGIFNLGDGATITGDVLSTGGVAGTLNFAGDGTVTGAIGTDAGNSPATISVQGDDTTNVVLNDDVFVGEVNFTKGGKLQLSGNLTTPNIDFGVNGGTLEFNGKNQYTLNAAIANGENGTLNALTTLTATDASIGTIKTINIGNDENLTISVNNANLDLLTTPNSSINFGDANSQLTLIALQDQTVTFAGNVEGVANGGGIVNLNGNGNDLTIDGDNGATIGTVGNELAALNISGNVNITDNLDVHNVNTLNIQSGAVFNDQSLTSAAIAQIKIGEAGKGGKATYSLNAAGRDFNLNTSKMTFVNEDSVLELQNSSDTDDSTITLTAALVPTNDIEGIVHLAIGDKNLTIDNGGNAAYTLGAVNHRLKQLDFVSTGNGTIDLNVDINVESIILAIKTIELGLVNANIYFAGNTVYTATGNVNGNVDFQNNAGVINLADGIQIDGTVTSSGGVNGTLNFEATGEVTGLITNLATLKAGAGNVSLSAGGNYSIDEIQGNGTNDLTFGANSDLTGSINTSGGQAVNLIFTDGGSVSGLVGSNAAVGNITVQAGTVNFASAVNSGNVIVSNGATVQINDNVTAADISGENDNEGTLKLNNPAPINVTGTVGNNNPLGTIEVANSDATVTGELNAQNINFSNAGQAATLKLGAASQVTNVTTAGNNIHTLAVTNFDTGNGAVGAADHRLKAIQLTGNGLVTVNTTNFYSGVTTANNEQGNVKLNIDGGIAYDLGGSGKSLASVQIGGNSTLKGDVYSKDISVNAGKNATFERGNNNLNPKALNVPDAMVDGMAVPRSLQLFTYLTDIKASSFNFADATSSAEFKDAALIDAPIDNGGTIKFNQNVWLKQEIKNAQNVEFSPNKFAILEKNIKAANLIADQASLVLLNDIEVNANLNVRDTVLDLATYELKHTGNVTHNGLLTLITYYDTTLKTGGHVLVGNGASVDMSGVDNLVVKIKSRSDITQIQNGDKHEIVRLEAGANFTPAPQNKVTIDNSGEQNRFVKWISDNTGLALIADDGTGGGGGGGGTGGGGDNSGGGGSGGNTGGGGSGGNTGGGGSGGNSGGGGSGGNGGSGLTPVFDPTPLIDDTKGSTVANGIANQLINSVTSFGNKTDASKLLNDLGLMPSDNVSKTLKNLGERVDTEQISEGLGKFSGIEVEDMLTDIAVDIDNLVSDGISGRMEELGDENALSGLNEPSSTLNNNSGANRRRRANQPQAPVAAGDEDAIGTGIWGVPFYGKATQKSKNGASGYKSNTGGGIIGFDYAIDNSIVVGAAYTKADSKLRHKNDKTGDRTKATSDIYSIYGLYNFPTNNFFVEAIGSYGKSRIKNYEGRITSTGNQTAIGKFSNSSYSGELIGGYNYLVSHLTTVTPMLGTRYATFKNNSYKETGTTFQNLSVRKNSYNKFEGILGLKGVTNIFVQDIKVKPELHGFMSYDFKGKLPNIDARLDGIDEPLTTIRFKPAKVSYNVGGGISTKYNMMEFGIRYNLSMAKKYMANQGSLKIKVNL